MTHTNGQLNYATLAYVPSTLPLSQPTSHSLVAVYSRGGSISPLPISIRSDPKYRRYRDPLLQRFGFAHVVINDTNIINSRVRTNRDVTRCNTGKRDNCMISFN